MNTKTTEKLRTQTCVHARLYRCSSEVGMIRLETLIELNIVSSSCSSLIIIRLVFETIIYRAIRADSISVNSTLPPLLASSTCVRARFYRRNGLVHGDPRHP